MYMGDIRYPGKDEHRAVVLMLATEDGTGIDSWRWYFEWSTTSFYIKSMHHALQGSKVSIHGPDDRYPGGQHCRFDVIRTPELEVDQKSAERAARAGGRWLTDVGDLPLYFEGRQISDHVAHVVRFSWEHDVFIAGAEPAGPSAWPKEKATMRVMLPVPEEGRVRHVDVFLSRSGEPYWPSGGLPLGFMKNDLGWCLSSVTFDWPTAYEPDPCGGLRGDTPVDQCARGIAQVVDDTGFLWLCEKLIPRGLEMPEPRLE